MIKAVITDIEGTITDIHFVHKVLFPYSREKMQSFLLENQAEPDVMNALNEVREIIGDKTANINTLSQQLIQWIDEDKKIGPLKTLQGMIWLEGYHQGQFKGHIYDDAFVILQKWHQENVKLYVYSSGSVKAQDLLFQYSTFGDIRYLFSGYFDTKVGPKKEPQSYQAILEKIDAFADETLFLSDVIAELDAAKESAMRTCLLNRDNQVFDENKHKECQSFYEIDLRG